MTQEPKIRTQIRRQCSKGEGGTRDQSRKRNNVLRGQVCRGTVEGKRVI